MPKVGSWHSSVFVCVSFSHISGQPFTALPCYLCINYSFLWQFDPSFAFHWSLYLEWQQILEVSKKTENWKRTKKQSSSNVDHFNSASELHSIAQRRLTRAFAREINTSKLPRSLMPFKRLPNVDGKWKSPPPTFRIKNVPRKKTTKKKSKRLSALGPKMRRLTR